MISMIEHRVKRAGTAGILVLSVLAPVAPAAADEVEVSTTDLEIPEASGLEARANEIPLSLDQALTIALQRNLSLLVQRYEREQFRLRVDENLGIYDFNLDGSLAASEETQPTASALEGADILIQESQNFNLTGSQLTPWGGTVGGQFNVFRRESNSAFAEINPFFFNDFDLTVTQPLLRNFGRVPTNRGILIAKLNSAQSLESFEQEVASTLQQVENAYWTLIEARAQLEVAEESRELAVELHDMNRIRVDVGTLAPLELIQSEVGISIRQEEIIRAEAAVDAAQDDLRELLNFDEGDLWTATIVPTTDPAVEPVEADLDESFRIALQERPELARQKLQVQVRELDKIFFDNQKLPRLDLSATYGYNGLGGDVLVRNQEGEVVDRISGGFSDAMDQLADRDFDGWQVQLTFGYPIQNRAARARAAIAGLDLSQEEAELNRLQLRIRSEVRAAIRDLRTAQQQIDSARASSRLAEQNLDAERKRYENGLSTSYQVLEIQEDLTSARSREVASVAAYHRALVEYHRAIGRLLEANGVELIDPSRVG